ncbi:uncharacterized protein LOC122080277 [Macadamia integrifolia]|uniref:uncharacterized protein LOC122080277 n=1 Tax=Macadamia integrifolia TaxID=60698 RepID=UPI001C4FBDEB|nr:uncharacterized protein LOC122080277 [Macadamia integrifolia]
MEVMVSAEEDEDGRRGLLQIAYDNVVRRTKQRRKQCLAMDSLKKGVFRRLSMISPFHHNLSADRRELIEARLCALIPQIIERTPNHPPYAEMIQRAIEMLEEGSGSTEESISIYITSTYTDLPWAHSHLLPQHLRRLTEAGEIISAPNSRYSLALLNPSNSTERFQQPHDDDNVVDAFPAITMGTGPPPGKPRKEPSKRPQRRKRGRGNCTKKPRSEQQESPQEVQVDTERKQPSLPPRPQPQQRQRGGLSRKRGRGQQTHPGEAIRTEYFDVEGSIVHPNEQPDVGSGEKVMELEASIMEFEEALQQKRVRRSRRGQKQPEEANGTETKGSVDHVDGDGLLIQPVEECFRLLQSSSSLVRRSRRGQKQPEEAIGTDTKGSVDHDSLMIQPIEENFPLLHSSSSPGEPVNQPEEVRSVASDVANNDSMSMVSCSEANGAAVGETGLSITNAEEFLQTVLPKSSREQVKKAEVRTTASDSNDSLMALSSGPIIAEMEAKGALASVGEDGEPFQTQRQLLPSSCIDEELNHPELGSFATDVCNDRLIVLSRGNAAVEKKDPVSECWQISQQQHLSALVHERQKHPEVGSAASVANNDDLVVLSIGSLPVVENVVNEKEKPEEQLPQEQQFSFQCTGDDDDVIVEFSWNPKSLMKEKEGKPNKKSASTRRYSLRLAEQCQQEEDAHTEPQTGVVLALPVVKKEWEEEASVIEATGKKKEKQPSERQQKPNRKAGKEKEKRPSELLQKPKRKAKNLTKEKNESGTKSELSQQQQKQQPKRHREEQKESGTGMEPSQKKQRDKHRKEEPKEMGRETDLSQQQVPKGQRKRGRPPKGPGLQQKQQTPKGQRKRGRPRKEPELQQKQQGSEGQDGSIEKKSSQMGKKITPLNMNAAARVGDVQSGKTQMSEIDQEPSEPQKKARGRGRPPKKKEVPVETTVEVSRSRLRKAS